MRYSMELNDQIIVKCYRVFSCAKKVRKNDIRGKYSPGMLAASEKFLDHANQCATDAMKTTLKKVIQKTAEAD